MHQLKYRRSVYFDDKSGTQIIDRFAPNGHFYDQDGVFVNLGTNRFVEIKGKWYYLNNSGFPYRNHLLFEYHFHRNRPEPH